MKEYKYNVTDKLPSFTDQPLFSLYQVIVERNGKIKLWCKGADSVINERLDPSCHDMQELTNHHLNVSALQFVIFNLLFFVFS